VQMRSARLRSMPVERNSTGPVRLCGLWVTDALTIGELQGSTTARNLTINKKILTLGNRASCHAGGRRGRHRST
jgi:hypothetical protein